MPHATRIWLVRHAESATPHVFHGAESDVQLSGHGHRQAAAAAAWFQELQPDLVASSAMRRAVDTAAPIATACGVEHIIEPAFHERRIGILGGTSFALDEGPWVETLRHWTAGDTAFTTPGAESYDDLKARLLPEWQRFVERVRGRRTVLVTHGIVCKVLLLTILPVWGPRRWHELGKVANLAVSEVCGDSQGNWSAARLLHVPEPVAAINETAADSADRKSQA